MISLEQEILLILSDGKFHSGEDMAIRLNVSRAAVWKRLATLKEKGAEVFSVKGKGYQIPGGLDLLSKSIIQEELNEYFPNVEQLEVFTSIASTNQFLMSSQNQRVPQLCLAEYQSSGRGRFGRAWHSPLARNIYLSLRHKLQLPLEKLSGLSLVVGCSLVKCLQRQGVDTLKLKWPNDLKVEGQKAGGILIEIAKATESTTEVVIGIGLNWDMPTDTVIDQHWTNLRPRIKKSISRNQLVVELVSQLMVDLDKFAESGFSGFKAYWAQHDELLNQTISIATGKKVFHGQAQGVDDTGALLVSKDGELLSFSGGEVSVRLAS